MTPVDPEQVENSYCKTIWSSWYTHRRRMNTSKIHGRRLQHDSRRRDRSSHQSLFEDIISYDDIKKLFGMALSSNEPIHILLSGPPASAKTVFMKCLMKLQDSYFVDGSNATKSGMVDYVFNNKPRYLLIDEIDKMPTKNQAFLLNLMETGIIAETKHRKTRTATNVKTWVFATSNNIPKVMTPLQSRFFTVKLEPYSYEQFYEITVQLLTR